MESSKPHHSTSILIKNMLAKQLNVQKNGIQLPSQKRQLFDGVPSAPPPSPASDNRNGMYFFNEVIPSADDGCPQNLDVLDASSEGLVGVTVQDTEEFPLEDTDTEETLMTASASLSRMPSCNTLFFPFENNVWAPNRVHPHNPSRQGSTESQDNWDKHISKIFAALGLIISSFVISLIYIFPKEN